MAQRSWSLGAVAKVRVAASCQKRQPAATRPANIGTPGGGALASDTAIGGWVSVRALVSVSAISCRAMGLCSPVESGVDVKGEPRVGGAQGGLDLGRSVASREDE